MQGAGIAVIGGGPAGMSAAVVLANSGLNVYLVEKEPRLGGKAAYYGCKATDRCNKCNVCAVADKIREVASCRNIKVLTGCSVERSSGEFGDYRLRLSNGEVLEVGAVVIATGFDVFDARLRPHLGYGRHARVVSAFELERALRGGRMLAEYLGGVAPRSVAFIQCVGSRDVRGEHDYCSRVCCMYSLRLAKVIREQLPAIEIAVFYMDFQGGGKAPQAFKEYCETAGNVRMIRSMPGEVRVLDGLESGEGAGERPHCLEVRYEDPDTGDVRRAGFDLVVLAVGSAPGSDTGRFGEVFGVGAGHDGFFDSPTGVPGIFVAGSCRGPMDIAEAMRDGEGVATEILNALARGNMWELSSSPTKVQDRPDRGQGDGSQGDHVVVVGGGLAGMVAAKTLADLGVAVTIVERDVSLGGRVHLSERPDVSALVERIMEDELISVKTSSRIGRLRGQAGNFEVILSSSHPGGDLPGIIRAGAIIVSTGHRLELPAPAAGAGLPDGGGVVTLSEFRKGNIFKEPAGRRVVFWVPVMAGNNGPAFRLTLRTAVRTLDRGGEVIVLCEDVKVAGGGMSVLYREARDRGAVFIKCGSHIPGVQRADGVDGEGGKLIITVRDSSLAGPGDVAGYLRVECDCFVIAEEMVPDIDAPELASILNVHPGPLGFFQEDNVHLLPADSSRRGIYFAGTCRGPQDEDEVVSDARVAALRAYRLISRSHSPVDWATASVDPGKCALCLTCLRSCPHAAIEVDHENRAARVTPIACQGCGVCVSECPARAITLKHLEVHPEDHLEGHWGREEYFDGRDGLDDLDDLEVS
ncbi:MAG: CoB--CoM heterodisulfide reductase iron-sulfur subunit A family protein [Firmicutes bacterium]|nr:CoB--CoM heterodisulfide reductase iron-sulfur subunit A family protein [Bacillota bacterium]